MTIEVVSLEEARELGLGEILDYEETENGYLCTFQDDFSEAVSAPEHVSEERYVVCCDYDERSKLYVTSKSVSFYLNDAKLFDKTTASRKAFFMSKRGGYKWRKELYQGGVF